MSFAERWQFSLGSNVLFACSQTYITVSYWCSTVYFALFTVAPGNGLMEENHINGFWLEIKKQTFFEKICLKKLLLNSCQFVQIQCVNSARRHIIYIYLVAEHGPLTRYVKLQVAHAPGMPGTFSPAADFKGNRQLAIPACITARAWRTCRDACQDRLPAATGKMFQAFPAHAHPQFCVSGKRPISIISENILATHG